jgi:hypothetical protein
MHLNCAVKSVAAANLSHSLLGEMGIFGAARNLDYVYTGALGRLYHNQVYLFVVRGDCTLFTSNRFVEAFRYGSDAATVSSQLGYTS